MRVFSDRRFWSRFALALCILLPPIALYERTQANADKARVAEERAQRAEDTILLLRHTDGVLAQERIDRTVAACEAYNEERVALIATSEGLIRIAISSSSEPLTSRDRLLLAAFVQRADRQIEAVSKPKRCTIEALHLQALEGIVSAEPPAPTGTTYPSYPALPHATTTTATTAPPAATTMPISATTVPHALPSTSPRAVCSRHHGACHPKG